MSTAGTAHFLGFYRPLKPGTKVPEGMTIFTPGFRYLNALVLYRDNVDGLERGGIRKVEVPLLGRTFEGEGMRPLYLAMIEIQRAVDELRPVDPCYDRQRDIFITVAPEKATQPIFHSWAEVSGISAPKKAISFPYPKREQARKVEEVAVAMDQKPSAPAKAPTPKPEPRKRTIPGRQMTLPGMGL